MLRGSLLFAAVAFATVAFAEDERPDVEPTPAPLTAEAVAAAVADSRAAYLEAHPVPSKQQKIASLQQQINDTQTAMRKLTGVSAAKKVEQLYNEITALKVELANVRRKYTPEVVTRLAAFANKDFRIGRVGRINDEADQSPVFCVRVLEGDAMLAYIETAATPEEELTDQGGSTRRKSPTFLLKGTAASAATAGQPIRGAFDVVVTEKAAHESDDGATQTVFVLQVFDPDRPFGG